jgi:hypothetical protein
VDTVANRSASERAEIFQATADETGLSPSAVEKDFWVCWVLKRIFETPELAKLFVFKGGTTLSKCFGLIERFSEDIDLILDWTELTEENPYLDRSNRQQDIFNKTMETKTREYVAGRLLPSITELLAPICSVIPNEERPKSLMVKYSKAFDSEYIKPEVELEIGAMAPMEPCGEFKIQTYCAEVMPDIFETADVDVRTFLAHKSFWDKVTILHVEAHRPEDKPQPLRYSRHYYDLFQMLNSPVKAEAMADLGLLSSIVAFKSKFYPQSWANYEGAANGTFRLRPEPHIQQILEEDYAQMEEMISGEYPLFDVILTAIEAFELELNAAHQP